MTRQGILAERKARPAGRAAVRKAAPKRRPPPSVLAAGMRFVAGVDEAGRGPLAGPVVAAAVILDIDRVPEGIDDSKALTPERREELFEAILATSIVSFAAASPAVIDRINIRQATLGAMARAVIGLPRSPLRVLVDGCDTPPIPYPAEAIVDGDAKSVSIAAASIVAKVARDRMMRRLARAHPDYGFDSHKGYSTPFHLDALLRLGPCRAHRMSFAPCAQAAFAVTG